MGRGREVRKTTGNSADGSSLKTTRMLKYDEYCSVNPSGAPEPLPVLNPSNIVPKNGFPVVKGLRAELAIYPLETNGDVRKLKWQYKVRSMPEKKLLLPSCFAVCGHHLTPRIPTVLLLRSSLQNSSMSHSSILLISSSDASRPSLYISRSPTMCVLLSAFVPHGHICASMSSSSRLLVYLFLVSGRSRSPTRNRSFSFFAQSIGACEQVFIPISSLNSPYTPQCFS